MHFRKQFVVDHLKMKGPCIIFSFFMVSIAFALPRQFQEKVSDEMGLMNLDIMDDYGQGNPEVDAYLKEKAEMEMELMKPFLTANETNMDFMLATLPFQDDVDSSYATNPMLSRAKILIIAESPIKDIERRYRVNEDDAKIIKGLALFELNFFMWQLGNEQ